MRAIPSGLLDSKRARAQIGVGATASRIDEWRSIRLSKCSPPDTEPATERVQDLREKRKGMAEGDTRLPFTLPASAIEMKRVRRRSILIAMGILIAIVVLVAGLPWLVLRTGPTAGGDSSYILPGLVVGEALGLAFALPLLISGLLMPAVPRDPIWMRALWRYRTQRTLKGNAPAAWQDLLARLNNDDLQVAAILPDHCEPARDAARTELSARGVAPAPQIPLVPNFVPLHDANRTRALLFTWSQPIRRGSALAMEILIWGSSPLWIPILLVLVATTVASLAGQNVDPAIAPLYGQILSGITWIIALPGLLLLPLTVLRRHPARLLFLRKFNSKNLSRTYKKLTRKELKPFGQVLGLSDRFMRDSWIRWFFRTSDPARYPFKLLFGVPFVLLMRCFDKIRFGPPTVDRAMNFRRFCTHLTQRKWINLRSSWTKDGLFIRTTDDYWQLVALTLLFGSDVIVLDMSEPTEGVEWEIATISRYALWSRVVVICGEDRHAQVTQRADSDLFGRIWTYNRKGRLADREGFREAVFAAVAQSVRWRWTLGGEAASAGAGAERGLPGSALRRFGIGGVIALPIVVALYAGLGGLTGSGGQRPGAPDGEAAAGAAPRAGASVQLRPGQWQMTTQVTRINVPNMPAGVTAPVPGPQTTTNCLTAEEAARANTNMWAEGCTGDNGTMTGGRIQGRLQCDGPQGRATIVLSGQYTAETIDLTTRQFEAGPGAQTMTMEAHITGRRIGDCTR